jgi:hypothetical protein
MISKSMIVVGASALVLSASLVFNGVAHLHAANSSQTASTSQANAQIQAAPKAADPADANIQVQPAATTDTATDTASTVDSAAASSAKETTATSDSTTDTGAEATSTAADDTTAAADTAEPIVVPAGTALTARLNEPLSSKSSEKGQAFTATLDQDVVVGGQTAISAGATITGKVVSANPAGKFAGEAALDLRLTSINVNSADHSLVTSIRTFGSPIKEKNKVGKVLIGLGRRASGDEREVVLASQSAYTFTLKQALEIQ